VKLSPSIRFPHRARSSRGSFSPRGVARSAHTRPQGPGLQVRRATESPRRHRLLRCGPSGVLPWEAPRSAPQHLSTSAPRQRRLWAGWTGSYEAWSGTRASWREPLASSGGPLAERLGRLREHSGRWIPGPSSAVPRDPDWRSTQPGRRGGGTLHTVARRCREGREDGVDRVRRRSTGPLGERSVRLPQRPRDESVPKTRAARPRLCYHLRSWTMVSGRSRDSFLLSVCVDAPARLSLRFAHASGRPVPLTQDVRHARNSGEFWKDHNLGRLAHRVEVPNEEHQRCLCERTHLVRQDS
jgi:hypothetical protein